MGGKFMSQRRAIATAVVTIIAGTSNAFAAPQDPAQSNNSSVATNSNQIEEVVVTAQKRAQNASEVGATITVSTGQMLKDLGVQNVSQLSDRKSTRLNSSHSSISYA